MGNLKQPIAISEEDALRADMYGFLAELLRAEPGAKLLKSVASLSGDESALGKSISTLSHLAAQIDTNSVRAEYVNLFIGVGRGELLPYGSYYLTGFLNEKPLAKLREDMRIMGIARADGVKEPEDHIASLFDMMSGLICGTFGREYSLKEQSKFFYKHIEPWAGLFFSDLEKAKTAVFYGPVGSIGKEFVEIEAEGFNMSGLE